MMIDDNDDQMIFGDLGGLKLPDICLTGEENPRKKPHPGNLSRPGIEPGPAAWQSRMLPPFPQRWTYLILILSTAVGQAVSCGPVTPWARIRSPVGTSFLGEIFWGFSSPVRQMSGSFRPQGPRKSFGHHYHHSLREPMTWDVDAP